MVGTLVTLVATLYAQYLSKRAKERKAQEARYVEAAEREKEATVKEKAETILANERIKKQNEVEEKFFGGEMKNPLDPEIWFLVCKIAKEFELDHSLVASIVMVESAGNTYAMRFEPLWKYNFEIQNFAHKSGSSIPTEEVAQSTSWGLMQVMGTVAREHGHTGFLPALCNPETGLRYGCIHLKKKMERFGRIEGVAAYNSGSPRKTEAGAFTNQDYVDKVFKWHEEFSHVTRPPV